ncbi:MAG: hypothetical protein ABL997_00710 [Planctomycetota bacterium]
MASEPSKVSGKLLLSANLTVGTLSAAAIVVAFVRPGVFGLEAIPGIDLRTVQLPLATPVAWGLFLGSIVLLLCNFAWLVRRSPGPGPRTHVMSESASGQVKVSREALESGLRNAGEALPEITRLRVQVDCAQPRRIVVQSVFQCAEGTSNLNASQRLRQALRERFADMVQLADGNRVEFELEFQGFFGKLAKKGDKHAALEPEPPPFTGPQYPIDDDEGGN